MDMTYRIPFFHRFLLVATVLLLSHTSAIAQDADAVFQRLLDHYSSISSLRADFTQTMTSSFSDDEASSSGTLFLSGDKYRVEMESQVLVTDGVATYVYLPFEKQVLINDYLEDESTFSPSDIFVNHDDRFEVTAAESEQVNGQMHFKLSLSPKSADSFFREATIWMRDADTIITRMEVLDMNETRMTFSLENIALDPNFEEGLFSFTPPEGVEVIDLRS